MHIQTFSAYVIRLGRVMKVKVTSITFYLVIGQAELNKAETTKTSDLFNEYFDFFAGNQLKSSLKMDGAMRKCMTVLILIIVYNNGPFTSAASIIKELKNPQEKYGFTNMAKYESDTVILGGTNHLYRIMMDSLNITEREDIGPRQDNPNCYDLENTQCTKQPYDSYIKALLIFKNKQQQQDELIICTSLFQGSCVKRNISTLELLPSWSDMPKHRQPVVANNRSATTVAFLAPGPTSDGSSQMTAMYVGASWTNTGLRAIRSTVPAFSSRNAFNFSLTFEDVATKSQTMVDEINRDSFPIRYIYGFASGNFSYIGTIQKPNVGAEDYVSKLIRVCLFDRNFYSYAETKLECEYNGKSYNLLQTAHVSKPGKHLAAALGMSKDEDVLFGMFGHGNPNDPINNNKESVMCIYPMREIKQVFTRNIKKCFEGIGRTGPEHISASRNCHKTVRVHFFFINALLKHGKNGDRLEIKKNLVA